jgi:hypothetical protein
MLVNLLLQDGKSNYMEGLMRKSKSSETFADGSHCAIPRDCTLVHSFVIKRTMAGGMDTSAYIYTRYPKYANLDCFPILSL